MAKPTPRQRYRLFLIGWMRWFGAIFAAVAVAITATNLPMLMRSRDAGQLGLNIGMGAAFLLIGVALYCIGTAVQRRYRAHIDSQID